MAAVLAAAAPAWAASDGFGPLNADGLPASFAGLPLASSGVGLYTDRAGIFVTPYHVGGHCGAALVDRPDGFWPASLVASDPERDLAIFKTAPNAARAVLRLAERDGPAAPRAIVRYAHLKGLASFERLDAQIASYGAGRTSLGVDASHAIVGGNSGSPVLLADETVGGLILSVAVSQPTLAFAVPAASLMVALSEVGYPPAWSEGLDDAPQTDDATAYVFPVLCYKAAPEPKAD